MLLKLNHQNEYRYIRNNILGVYYISSILGVLLTHDSDNDLNYTILIMMTENNAFLVSWQTRNIYIQ